MKKQVKSFLGLASLYRNFIPEFAEIATPLISLTSPKIKFKWAAEHDKSFSKLQRILFNLPFLYLPDWNKNFT